MKSRGRRAKRDVSLDGFLRMCFTKQDFGLKFILHTFLVRRAGLNESLVEASSLA
jgi:hypothetical protein